MGFNAVDAGFHDVEAMVEAMCQSEDAQLQGMIGFIEKNRLQRYLQNEYWASFASHYNGTDFQKNNYDSKLKMAAARFKVGPLPSLQVRAAQLYLTYLGYAAGTVDGWYGTKTQQALLKFQKDRALTPTGMLSDETAAALQKAAAG